MAALSWFFVRETAHAQLTWGVGGNGGSGTWDTTTANWWNGSANVPWVAGGSAVFTGSGGTVSAPFPGPNVGSMTFDAAGYSLIDGSINGTNIFTITTNQSATINTTLSGAGVNDTLIKNGAAPLTITGTNFFDRVQVNAGEFRVTGRSSLFFSDVILANAPDVVLTLGSDSFSTSLGSLSGGGSAGGVIQPDDRARTLSVTVFGSGTFGGVAQDNGSGKLGFQLFVPSVQTFTGVNTYSGDTQMSFGTTVFNQGGSALNSAMKLSARGTLRLDNSSLPVANRISDSLPMTMDNGRLDFIGHGTTTVEEQFGALTFSGASSITATQPGAAAAFVTFASATRKDRATLNFSGTGRAKWIGMTNDSFGIIGAYTTFDNEWATVGADGRAEALAIYAVDINAATAADHVKINGGGTTVVAASMTRATLNFQNSSGTEGILQLNNGQTLTLGDGGILSSGTATGQIKGGALQIASDELVVTNRNAFTIDSNITETLPGTGFTKSGTGLLTLTGNNSYSGTTVIEEGTLAVSSDTNLGTGPAIQFNGGTLRAAASFSSPKALTRGSTFGGTIDTNGFDVTFTGPSTTLSKTGAGTLTLTNPAIQSVSVSKGTLALSGAPFGVITLNNDAKLIAAGTLSGLSMAQSTTLDIGGDAAATLTLDSFSPSGTTASPITVRFGLGVSASDVWTVSNPFGSSVPFSQPSGSILFDFTNLGGAAPDVAYTLINVSSSSSLTPQLFGFAPVSVTAGWSGVFSVSPTAVRVNFTSVPEPGSIGLLGCGLLWLGSRRRRRASHCSPALIDGGEW